MIRTREIRLGTFNKVSTVFHVKGLKLPQSTRIEIRGQDKKKDPFILALCSTKAKARTFENQMAEARRKEALKIKTVRMEPQGDPAFPIPAWQITLEHIKTFATAGVEELKSQYEGDDAATANIEVCKKRIKEMKYWHLYNPQEKNFFM